MKISVIFPVYGVQSYVYNSLKSILNQTYKNVEVIVINDASPDESLNVMRKINDSRIKIINNKKNVGLAKARNIGLKYVSGDIVYFMDSDDEVRPNLFENIVKQFEIDPTIEMVCFSFEKVNNQMKFDNLKKVQILNKEKLTSQNALIRLMKGDIATTAWSYMIRASFLRETKFSFSSGKLFEDMNTTSFLLSKVNKVDLIDFYPKPYLYLQREGSIMGKNKNTPSDKEIDDNLFMILEEYKIFRTNLVNKELADHWLLDILLYYYEFYYIRIHTREPLKQYLKEIKIIVHKLEKRLSYKEKVKIIMVRIPVLFILKNIL